MGSIILLVLAVLGVILLINVVGFTVNLLIMLLVWGVTGWLASRLVGGDGMGVLGNVLAGAVGGILGRLLFSVLGIGLGLGFIGDIIVGVVGAILLIFLIRAVSRNPNFGM